MGPANRVQLGRICGCDPIIDCVGINKIRHPGLYRDQGIQHQGAAPSAIAKLSGFVFGPRYVYLAHGSCLLPWAGRWNILPHPQKPPSASSVSPRPLAAGTTKWSGPGVRADCFPKSHWSYTRKSLRSKAAKGGRIQKCRCRLRSPRKPPNTGSAFKLRVYFVKNSMFSRRINMRQRAGTR
jgi:hypothetical protein